MVFSGTSSRLLGWSLLVIFGFGFSFGASLLCRADEVAAPPVLVKFVYRAPKGAPDTLPWNHSGEGDRLIIQNGAFVSVPSGQEPPALVDGNVRCELIASDDAIAEPGAGRAAAGWPVREPVAVLSETNAVVAEGHHEVRRRVLALPGSSGLRGVACDKRAQPPTDEEVNAAMKGIVQVSVASPFFEARSQLGSVARTLQSWWARRKLAASGGIAEVPQSKVESDVGVVRPDEPPAAVLVDSDVDGRGGPTYKGGILPGM